MVAYTLLVIYKKFTSFYQVLKEMHTKENWFLFLPHGVETALDQRSRSDRPRYHARPPARAARRRCRWPRPHVTMATCYDGRQSILTERSSRSSTYSTHIIALTFDPDL